MNGAPGGRSNTATASARAPGVPWTIATAKSPTRSPPMNTPGSATGPEIAARHRDLAAERLARALEAGARDRVAVARAPCATRPRCRRDRWPPPPAWTGIDAVAAVEPGGGLEVVVIEPGADDDACRRRPATTEWPRPAPLMSTRGSVGRRRRRRSPPAPRTASRSAAARTSARRRRRPGGTRPRRTSRRPRCRCPASRRGRRRGSLSSCGASERFMPGDAARPARA